MAPEQASGDPKIDHRTDLYSIGIILYEMCLGELPFKSNTAMGYLGKHIVEPPIPPKEARPDIDLGQHLERVILKSLEKPREARYQTAAAMLQDLEERVFPAIFGTEPPASVQKEIRKRKLAKLALILLALGLLSGGGWFGLSQWRASQAKARAESAQRLGEAVAAGDIAKAKAIVDELGPSDDPAVAKMIQEFKGLVERVTALAQQKTLIDEGDASLAKENFAAARERYRAAEKISSNELVRSAFERLDMAEKSAAVAVLVAAADRQLALNELELALAKLKEAQRIRSTYDIERRIDRVEARLLLRDADERRAARQDKEAAEKRRQALRLLGGEGAEAESAASQHAKHLLELAGKLSLEDAQAYHDELMAAARAREAERDFRGALIALRDAKLFVSGDKAREMAKLIEAGADKVAEQRSYELALGHARRAQEASGPAEREGARDKAKKALQEYQAQYPSGHFLQEAARELARLE